MVAIKAARPENIVMPVCTRARLCESVFAERRCGRGRCGVPHGCSTIWTKHSWDECLRCGGIQVPYHSYVPLLLLPLERRVSLNFIFLYLFLLLFLCFYAIGSSCLLVPPGWRTASFFMPRCNLAPFAKQTRWLLIEREHCSSDARR